MQVVSEASGVGGEPSLEHIFALLQRIGWTRQSLTAVPRLRFTHRDHHHLHSSQRVHARLGYPVPGERQRDDRLQRHEEMRFQYFTLGSGANRHMNRVLPCGPLGVANRVRQVLGLPQLTEKAAQKAQAHDRRNMKFVTGQEYMTQDQKQQQTLKRYKTKDAISARTTEYKQRHKESIAADPITPTGLGMYGGGLGSEQIVRRHLGNSTRGRGRGGR